MDELGNAKCIKALFIDNIFFNDNYDEKIIGSEVMFSSNKVIADLIILSSRSSIAFEVKAKNDDLRKLEKQLIEYNKVFDFVNVIITENHFEKAKILVPERNGIILISNDHKFEIYRKPQLNTDLDKVELLATMSIKFVKRHYKISSNYSATEIRRLLEGKSIDELRLKMYEFLFERISSRFENFLAERGTFSHYEDVSLLSLPNKRILE